MILMNFGHTSSLNIILILLIHLLIKCIPYLLLAHHLILLNQYPISLKHMSLNRHRCLHYLRLVENLPIATSLMIFLLVMKLNAIFFSPFSFRTCLMLLTISQQNCKERLSLVAFITRVALSTRVIYI